MQTRTAHEDGFGEARWHHQPRRQHRLRPPAGREWVTTPPTAPRPGRPFATLRPPASGVDRRWYGERLRSAKAVVQALRWALTGPRAGPAHVPPGRSPKGGFRPRYGNVSAPPKRPTRAGQARQTRSKPGHRDTSRKHRGPFHLPRYRRRNKREMLAKPVHGKHKALHKSTRSGRGGTKPGGRPWNPRGPS